MPQCSDELAALMVKWFGRQDEHDRIPDENIVIRFLESRGYTLKPNWCWTLPTPAHTVSNEEYACLAFLIDEWDFGPVAPSGVVSYPR